MHDQTAEQLLANVMEWQDLEEVQNHLSPLQLLANYKYDHYQRFGPGWRFIENLALWLHQFSSLEDRKAALRLVREKLIYFSESEFTHLVRTAYPDWIVQERIRLVAEEHAIPAHRVGEICRHSRFKELQLKSLYLGLSDGARTNELRRASSGEISNEQIWQAYELGEDKAGEMQKELGSSLRAAGFETEKPRFNLVWLIDDFSGSGNTYIRYDSETRTFKGKIKKIFERLHRGDLVDISHYEVFLLLYAATRQAMDHIEYWSDRFTSEHRYKPLQIRVLCPIGQEASLTHKPDSDLAAFLNKSEYYDQRATDKHIAVGGTDDARLGFAGCALPLVLSHNTPNNSIYLLWGPESFKPFGLFPRVSRHREF
jgi:hypothetical protein